MQPCGGRQDQEAARDRLRRPGRQGRPGRVADPRRHFCIPQSHKRTGGSGPYGSGITPRRARRRPLELHELRRRPFECSVRQPVLVDDRSIQLPWKARAGPEGYADRSGRPRARLSYRPRRGQTRASKTTLSAPTFAADIRRRAVLVKARTTTGARPGRRLEKALLQSAENRAHRRIRTILVGYHAQAGLVRVARAAQATAPARRPFRRPAGSGAGRLA